MRTDSTPASHRLTSETLGAIFTHAYHLSHEKRQVTGHFRREYTCWTTRPLWVLGSVCVKWRKVVRTGCPQLWAYVCTAVDRGPKSTKIRPDPPSVLQQQLEFAKGSLLDITAEFDPQDETSPFNVLYEYRSRWQRAHVIVGQDGGDEIHFSEPVQLDVPELQYLRLDFASFVERDGGDAEEDFPFDITAPKLKQVEIVGGLMGVSTPSIKLPWSQLTHVSLAFDDMRDILKYVALLKDNVECLSVLDAVSDSIGYWPYEMPEPTTFPKLSVLELRSGEFMCGEYEPLLNMLIAPALRSIIIRGQSWPYAEDVANVLKRSNCQLEDFAMITRNSKKHFSALLPYASHLTSLCLNREPSKGKIKEACPLFKRFSKVEDSDSYQTQIFHPVQSWSLWGTAGFDFEDGLCSNSDDDEEEEEEGEDFF